jgi:hypothetical protein
VLFILLLAGLGLTLITLIMVAVTQRRHSNDPTASTASSERPVARPLAATPSSPIATTRPARQISALGIAIGVWLGLWLFVLSAAIPFVIILNKYAER